MEWLAFASGLKPAIRRTTEPGRAEEVERRLARGAVVLRARQLASIEGREQVVLYAARTGALAAALRDAESAILPGHVTAEDIPAAHRALGRALGFPACCVEAFCSRISRGVDRLTAGGQGGFSEDYVAARDAWVRAADARVNPMLMSCGAQLVSFYPCRLDCRAAVTQAEALRSLLHEKDPGAARSLMSTLARAMILSSDGARAQVIVDAAGRVVRSAAPTLEGRASPRDVRLAGLLVGAQIEEGGAVRGLPSPRGEPPWCLRFDAPRQAE